MYYELTSVSGDAGGGVSSPCNVKKIKKSDTFTKPIKISLEQDTSQIVSRNHHGVFEILHPDPI